MFHCWWPSCSLLGASFFIAGGLVFSLVVALCSLCGGIVFSWPYLSRIVYVLDVIKKRIERSRPGGPMDRVRISVLILE